MLEVFATLYIAGKGETCSHAYVPAFLSVSFYLKNLTTQAIKTLSMRQ